MSGLRRIRRGLLRALLILAALLAVAVLATLLPASRSFVATQILVRVSEALPGRLEYASLSWGLPLRLEFEDLCWSDGSDTLVASQRLRVAADVGALLRRDLHLQELLVESGRVDVAAIRERFGQESNGDDASEASFPREGSLAPLPSIGIDAAKLDVHVLGIRSPLKLRSSASIDLLSGSDPMLELVEFEAALTDWGIHAEGDRIAVRPALRTLEGGLRLRLRDGRSYQVSLESQEDGVAVQARRIEDEAIQTSVSGRLDWLGADGVPEGARFAISLEKLDLVELLRLFGVESWPKQISPQRAASADLEGFARWSRPRRVQSRIRLDQLVELPPIEGTLHWSADSLAVTDFVAEEDALGVRGEWSRLQGRHSFDADLRLQSGTELRRFGVNWPASLRDRDLRADVVGTLADSLSARFELAAIVRDHRVDLRGNLGHGKSGWSIGLPPLRRDGTAWSTRPDVTPNASLRWQHSRLHARHLIFETDVASAQIDGELTSREAGFEFSAEALLESSRWAQHLPERVRADDLGPLRAALELDGERRAGALTMTARMDPRDTAWIQGEPFSIRYDDGAVEVDSLRLNVAELDLYASGRWGTDGWNAHGDVSVQDVAALKERLSIEQELEAQRLGVEWSVTGPTREPQVELMSTWREISSPIEVPELEVDVLLQARRLHAARLRTLDGLRWRGWPVQSVQAELRHPETTGDGPDHWLGFVVEGDSLQWAQVLRFSWGDSVTVVSDSLGIRWRERDLHTTQPFHVMAQPGRRHLEVRDLALRGSLGELSAEWSSSEEHFEAQVDANLRPGPVPGALLDGPWSVAWPQAVTATLQTNGPRSLRGNLTFDGLRAGPDRDLKLTVFGELDSDSLRTELALGTKDAERRLNGWLRAPVRWEPSSATRFSLGDATRGEFVLESVALPTRHEAPQQLWRRYLQGEGDPQPAPRLSAKASIGHRFRTELRGKVSFPAGHALASDALALEALRDSTSVISGRLEWKRAAKPLLESEFRVEADSSREWSASLKARRLNLADLDDLLGRSVGVEGLLDVDLQLRRGIVLPFVDGTLQLTNVQASRSDGSQIAGDASLEFRAAEGEQQIVRGRAEVRRGIVRLNEQRRELYPRDGESLLWSTFEIEPPPIAQPPQPGILARLSAMPAEAQPDLEFLVDIPGGVRLRSSRFDVELQGDLRVATSGGRATIAGELRPIGGGVRMLNSYFRATSGTVSFLGTDELDPRLDLVLETERPELKVELLITGRASEPVITLRSEPALDEGEILSRLYFNSSSDNLDSSQSDFLAFQAMSLAQTYAVPGIEQQMVTGLGLDVVRIGQSETKPGTQSLTAGKYISPRVLLSYEKRLASNESYVLNLSYWMTRSITLDSTIGNIDPSTVEVNWTKNW